MKRNRMIVMLVMLALAGVTIGYALAQDRDAADDRVAERPRRENERERPRARADRDREPGRRRDIERRPTGRFRGEPERDPSGEVRQRLRQTMPKVDFSGIAFKDVIQFLREHSGINIFVKWTALKAVGIDKKSPVNVKLTNVTVGKVLRTILEDVGGVNPLGFVVDENVITISTIGDLAQARHIAMQERVMAGEMKFPRRQAERMEQMIGLIQRMKHVCFDSQAVCVMAVGALKDEIPRKNAEIIEDLEGQLSLAKTQGLRNAIRLTLKDLYKRQGDKEKVFQHLKALIAENDKALQAAEKK